MSQEQQRFWKTLSRRDPDFLAHLEGRFSDDFRALPLRSLNVGSSSELVTFEIVPLREIQSPSLIAVLWQLIRPQTLALSIGPMLVILILCWSRSAIVSPVVALSSFLGALLFHIAVNLLNDYGDHIKGQDRLKPSGGSRVIQNGWLPAHKVKVLAWLLTALAAICGLPAVLLHLHPVALVIGLVGLVGVEFAFQTLRLKARGLAEVLAFLLAGPFLTAGYAWAISGQIESEDVILGCLFGAISVLYFHAANFENLMTDNQAGVQTSATRLGFDSSKRFFHGLSAAVLGLLAIEVFLFHPQLHLLAVFLFVAVRLFLLNRRVRGLASPLSSELTGLREAVLALSWFVTALLTVSLFSIYPVALHGSRP